MFSTIKIEGLGPLDGSFDLPAGESTITGRSEVGKSSLLTALCFCLWGTDEKGRPLPVEAISDGYDAVTVEAATAKGTRFLRAMDRERKTKRELYAPGEDFPAPFRSEKDWTKDALTVLGRELQVGKRRVHAGRLIAVPFAWEELASSAGGGMELRDALDAIVGGDESIEDVVRSLMDDAGEDLWDGAPMSVKAAEDWRRTANQRVDRATGSVTAKKETLETIESAEPSTGPSESEIASARAVLVDAETWSGHNKELRAYLERAGRRGREIEDWHRRVEAMGTEPSFSSVELTAAERDVSPAEGRLKGFTMTLAKVRGQLEAFQTRELDESERGKLEAKLKAYQDHAGSCPECCRKWSKAADVIADLEAQLTDQAAGEKSATVLELEGEVERLEGEVQSAETNLETKRGRVARLKEAKERLDAWNLKRAELPGKPGDLEEEPPEAPDLDQPTEDDVRKARSVLELEGRAAGADQEREAQVEKARGDLKVAEGALQVAQSQASAAAALVDALRRAPSERLRRSLARLGDVGPVSFRLEGDGIGVYVDGRPHWLASRGRRIFADLCLRLALRKALRMTWFPVFVDDVQSWSEEWPETAIPGPDGTRRPTPVVYLQTANQGLDIAGGRP